MDREFIAYLTGIFAGVFAQAAVDAEPFVGFLAAIVLGGVGRIVYGVLGEGGEGGAE